MKLVPQRNEGEAERKRRGAVRRVRMRKVERGDGSKERRTAVGFLWETRALGGVWEE